MSGEEKSDQLSPISAKDGVELSLQAGQNVDKHWTQFFVFLFGLLGWLSSSLSSVGHKEALIISLAATIFFGLNAIAVVRAYIILNLIVAETIKVLQAGRFLSPKVNKILSSRRQIMYLPLRIPIAILSHVAGVVAIAYLVWGKVK
jgi:hypothetical protein